jgi:YggT family protein
LTPLGVLAASGPGVLGVIVADLLGLYALAIFAMCILSWFPIREGTGMSQVYRFLLRITDPVILPVRRAMPSMGAFDVSPIIVLFTILLVRSLILG